MHSFDEIESVNAKEWNLTEEKPRSDSTGTEKEQRRMQDNQHATDHQHVYCNNENTTTSQGMRIVDSYEGTNGHNARFIPRNVRTLDGYKPGGKRQVEKASEWSKTTAVNTRRMQAHLNQAARKANINKTFSGQIPTNKFDVVGFYHWSDSNSAPSELLGEGLQLLNDVRSESQVFIDYVERLGCIRLRSYHFTNIESGIADVKAKIKHAEADVAALAPLYMVEPPSTVAMRSEVTPIFKATENSKHQLVVEKVVLSGSRLSAEEAARFECESKTMLRANRELFSRHLKQASTYFQSLKGGMHMRVNFGQFNLLMYRKDFKESTYSFNDFSRMMGENRTKACFNQSIHARGFGAEFLDSIKRSTAIFEPADSTTSCLAAVEPKHSLIVLAYGSSNAKVRVEADMDIVDGAGETQGGVWQVGAATYYQHNDRKTCLIAGSVSFESFDWRLETFSDRTLVTPSTAFQEILTAVAFAKSVYAIEGCSFIFPLVTPQVPFGITIEEYWMRSIFQYQLIGTSYIIEVSIYRGWCNGEMNRKPSMEFQISFYHADWAFLTIPEDCVTVHSDWVRNSFFPANSIPGNGFDDFRRNMRTVQSFLSSLYSVTQKARDK